jgi:hypothetical protein
MFIGHIGLGLAAKRVVPKVSLGVLLLSCEALDILCGTFVLLGIEKMKPHPGDMAMSSLEFISFPWSHGLAASLVWALIGYAVSMRLFRNWRTSLVISSLIFSHWILDFISHRPDLPILGDGSLKLGLGLWNSVAGTLIVEIGLLIIGVILYTRTTTRSDREGVFALSSLVIFFTALFFLNHFGPQPPTDMSPRKLVLPIFAYVLLLPWGIWIDRHRVLRGKYMERAGTHR